jgi:hypothetical protein
VDLWDLIQSSRSGTPCLQMLHDLGQSLVSSGPKKGRTLPVVVAVDEDVRRYALIGKKDREVGVGSQGTDSSRLSSIQIILGLLGDLLKPDGPSRTSSAASSGREATATQHRRGSPR